MKTTRQITEAGLFAGILVIFIVGSFYIPLIGSALYLLAPLPLVLLSIRNTKVNVVVAGIVAMIISSLLVSATVGVSMGLMALLIGLPLGLSIKRFDTPLKAIGIGVLGGVIALLVTLGVLTLIMGVSFEDTLDQMFETSKSMQTEMDKMVESYAKVLSTEQQAQIKANLEDQAKIMDNMLTVVKLIIPAGLILMACMLSALNYFAAIPILRRLKIAHRPLGDFRYFTYPKHLAYGSAAMLLGAYLLGTYEVVDFGAAMLNFIYLFMILFYVQGLAVGYFFFRKSLSKGVTIAILTVLSLFGLMTYISLIGFMDVMIDVRRLQPKKR